MGGTPITFHEACKRGNVKAVQDYLAANGESAVDEHDSKGITALGYAIGANRGAVVKLLVEKKADPFKVDSSGCSGLHYAGADALSSGHQEQANCHRGAPEGQGGFRVRPVPAPPRQRARMDRFAASRRLSVSRRTHTAT